MKNNNWIHLGYIGGSCGVVGLRSGKMQHLCQVLPMPNVSYTMDYPKAIHDSVPNIFILKKLSYKGYRRNLKKAMKIHPELKNLEIPPENPEDGFILGYAMRQVAFYNYITGNETYSVAQLKELAKLAKPNQRR